MTQYSYSASDMKWSSGDQSDRRPGHRLADSTKYMQQTGILHSHSFVKECYAASHTTTYVQHTHNALHSIQSDSIIYRSITRCKYSNLWTSIRRCASTARSRSLQV